MGGTLWQLCVGVLCFFVNIFWVDGRDVFFLMFLKQLELCSQLEAGCSCPLGDSTFSIGFN